MKYSTPLFILALAVLAFAGPGLIADVLIIPVQILIETWALLSEIFLVMIDLFIHIFTELWVLIAEILLIMLDILMTPFVPLLPILSMIPLK